MNQTSNSVTKPRLFVDSHIARNDDTDTLPDVRNKLIEAQIALLVKNNIAAADWDEYVHMRPCARDEGRTPFAFLRNYAHKGQRFMTYRTGFYVLGTGLLLLAACVTVAVLTGHQVWY